MTDRHYPPAPPHHAAVDDPFAARVLAKLPPPDQEPVSTEFVGDYLGLGQIERSTVLWSCLDGLASSGLVERVPSGQLFRYWRRTPAGDQRIQALRG